MSKTYAELISEVNEVATEIFNGREFKYIEPGEDVEIGQIVSGSERHLSGHDEAEGGTVDVTEQYTRVSGGDGIFIPRHCLELAWGNYNEDEIVTVDLDKRELNDSNGYRYTSEAAITMAEHVLKLLEVVKPAELHTVPETDLSQLEGYMTEMAMFGEMEQDQLIPIKIGFAVFDNLVGYVAKRELSGKEFREDIFARIVKRLRKQYSLSEAEVDQVIDLRMQEMAQAQSNNTSRGQL